MAHSSIPLASTHPFTVREGRPPGAGWVSTTVVRSVGNTLYGGYPFVDSSGIYTQIDFPGAQSTQALGINNSGQVVGDYETAFGRSEGFVYSAGVYTHKSILRDRWGLPLSFFGINDNGQIVGDYVDKSGHQDAFLGIPSDTSSVPEPGSLVYFGTVGLMTLCAKVFKNKRA